MMQITYQKQNGCVFQRFRNTLPPYEIGETTSMGWKVLNIEYEYRNKYYSQYEYNRLLYKNKQKFIRQQQIKELCIKELKIFLQFLIILLILYYIK